MKKHTTLLLIFFLLYSCTFPELKTPEFQRSSDEVIGDIKVLANFKDADIQWSASSFDGKTQNILLVQLINGNNLPEDESSLRELGKEAIQIVINSIENESDFNEFHVEFITNEESPSLIEKNKTRTFIFQAFEVDKTRAI